MALLAQLFGGGGRGGCSVRRRSNSVESAGGTTEAAGAAPAGRSTAPPAPLRAAVSPRATPRRARAGVACPSSSREVRNPPRVPRWKSSRSGAEVQLKARRGDGELLGRR